jgi:Uma2 family endonuclease
MEDDMTAPARAFSGNMEAGEFLKFMRTRPKEERWQLIEGVAVMMNPPTLVHQLVALNFRDLIKEALARKGLDLIVLVESGVRVRGVTKFRPRPDVIVIPEITGDEIYADRFLLAAEVLSPSNTKSLIARKVRLYKEHPDNLYSLVIDSKRVWLQIYSRLRNWEPVTLDDPADVLELPKFGLRCAVGELYRQTPFDPARTVGKRHGSTR